MLISHKFEGKNKETLKEECLKELNTEEIYLSEEVIETGLFKTKKYILYALSKEEIINYIKDYINSLSKNMNIEITSEIRIINNTINVTLVTSNNSILIGKDGKNLDAIQLLLRQSLADLRKYNLRILVDIGNYKTKKIKNLEYEIKKICKEILKTKVEVKLDPMNSYERRIIHTIVSNFTDLESNSFGEEPNRYIVIKHK